MSALTANQKHKILRNIYRNYITYRDYLTREGTQLEFIEHKGVNISFTDLKEGVSDLAPRKKEAFFYHVILDWSQKDTANIMGITTVSVGQYVNDAMHQLCKRYFAEDEDTSS